MPEPFSGPPRIPARGDSEQWLRDTLARLEAQQEMLARAVAELTAQAEAWLPPPAGRPAGRRRAATFLRLVPVLLIAVIGLAVIAAAPGHRGQVRHRAVRCTTSCQRPDGRQDRAANLG